MVPNRFSCHILILLLLVLFELKMGAYSRPIGRKERSSEDVLMGVDFLSIFLNSAEAESQVELQNSEPSSLEMIEELTTTTSEEFTTIKDLQIKDINKYEAQREAKTEIESSTVNEEAQMDSNQLNNEYKQFELDRDANGRDLYESRKNVLTSTESQTDLPYSRTEKTVKRQAVNIASSTEKTSSVVPITLLSLEMNTEVYINKNRPVSKKTIKPSVLINNPSEIILESKKNNFNVELSEPITLENGRASSKNTEIQIPIKPEEIIARGANPDYIAQQIARIQKERQNDSYSPKRNPSRARAVSYSSVVQVLPHVSVHTSVNRQLEAEQRNKQNDNAHISRSNIYNVHFDANGNMQTPKPKEYHEHLLNQGERVANHQPYNDNIENYDYLNANTNPAQIKDNTTGTHQGDATAESKDYFVTRKYNPDDYNDSREKQIFQSGSIWAGSQQIYNRSKTSYEPRERDWGTPEKNYEEDDVDEISSGTIYNKPEENYEIDEASSVLSNGRLHGVQNDEKTVQIKVGQKPTNPDDNQKIGYVVEGRNYKKYRVEERTADGFIVGEYGVVSNNDGSLRGVRYTADGTINPRVIYNALMKFLSL